MCQAFLVLCELGQLFSFGIERNKRVRLGIPFPAVPKSGFKPVLHNRVFDEDRFQVKLLMHRFL